MVGSGPCCLVRAKCPNPQHWYYLFGKRRDETRRKIQTTFADENFQVSDLDPQQCSFLASGGGFPFRPTVHTTSHSACPKSFPL